MTLTSSTKIGDGRTRVVRSGFGGACDIRAPARSALHLAADRNRAAAGLTIGAASDGNGRGQARGACPVDVAIADKSPLILAGLEALLNEDNRFNLISKVNDGEEFLDAVRLQQFSIAVIGWQLPTVHAREVLRALSRQAFAPKIVVYSGTNDPAAPAETLALGGAGFVSKRAPPERLLAVLAAVAAGDMVFPFIDFRKMRSDPLENLTLRERSLLSALGSGHTNGQLARDFGVSINTIKFHLRNLFEKLQVRNRAQAIALFLEMKHGAWSAAPALGGRGVESGGSARIRKSPGRLPG
ncbi:MAG: response regulator transcription factor [Methylocystis sp.]|nr:response regulator transcription factor [Methylocystis sp.]